MIHASATNVSARIYFIALMLTALFLSGCLPEESPIAPYPRGSTKTKTVAMGADYRMQVFVCLDQNSVVDSVHILEWDIAFESAGNGFHLLLNQAKFCGSARYTSGNAWDSLFQSTDEVALVYDASNGNLDSTSIGSWWSSLGSEDVYGKGDLYILHLGTDERGRSLGYRKLRIVSCRDNNYTIEFKNLDGTNYHKLVVPRRSDKAFVHCTLRDGGRIVEDAEPASDRWDIVFTKYVFAFWEPDYYPYSVVGVLLNRENTLAAVDSSKDYADITAQDISNYTFSSAQDIIGYSWKDYDLANGIYTVFPQVNYIIRDSKGFYYKLHFLDFYDERGQKGSPTYEFAKL